MRPADMAAIAEAMKYALGESPHDLLARVERDLEQRGYALPHARREEPERCSRCGGLKHDRDHDLSSDAVCRCGGRVRRLKGYLDAVDPGGRMTLESLDASEPTLAAALREARGIGAGERRRGMLLLGPPGRGKTHLMVGLGRDLLGRERDAGYYNVVRLVSRIQDTYGEHGEVGDTRRVIIESVASHEIVLLDDLGKEHASTNVESIVYELFDALYAARITLVVATNVPAARGEGYRGPTLSERYDEAVRSRLRAMCERFVVKGEDRRQATWKW